MRLLKFLLLLIALIFLFASCKELEAFTYNEYTSMLMRIRELFSLCSVLLGQSDTFVGDMFSRLYYGYYNIGRLIFSNIYGYDYPSHNQVWKKMNEPIKFFGFTMKSIREKYEYYPLSPNDIQRQSKEDIKVVLSENKFNEMILELRNTLLYCEKYSKEEKEVLFNEIKLLELEHEKFLRELKKKP